MLIESECNQNTFKDCCSTLCLQHLAFWQVYILSLNTPLYAFNPADEHKHLSYLTLQLMVV
jgi:hypothetical protein